MLESSYTVLMPGWGCSCPEDRAIESEEECLAAANEFVQNGYFDNSNQEENDMNNIELRSFDYRWKYGPCGCFFWKGGRKVYYTGDMDDLHCLAVQWAELICKKEESDGAIPISEVIGTSKSAYVPPDQPENSTRKCLDWIEFLPFRLKRNRDFCMVPSGELFNGPHDEIGSTFYRQATLTRCEKTKFTSHGHLLFTHLHRLETKPLTCLTAGKELGSPVFFAECVEGGDDSQVWVYDSDGKYQNVLNGGYLQVEGCNIVENANLVTQTFNNSIENQCNFNQWVVYKDYNNVIDVNGAIWTRVIPIYVPLIVSIICIIITGIKQAKQQRSRTYLGIRRPGVAAHTAPATLSQSNAITN